MSRKIFAFEKKSAPGLRDPGAADSRKEAAYGEATPKNTSI